MSGGVTEIAQRLNVNIRLTRFNKVSRLSLAILAAQVIRLCALASHDVGSALSSKRSSPSSGRLTGIKPQSLLAAMRLGDKSG